MVSYDELAQALPADLAFLHRHDFITFLTEAGCVQVIQNRDHLSAELFIERPVTAEEHAAILARGWQDPQQDEPTWWMRFPWPLSAVAAQQLAHALVDAARTFVSADIELLECNARNYETAAQVDLPSLRGLRRVPDRR